MPQNSNIEVIVNDQVLKLDNGVTVEDLIAEVGVSGAFAVEVNGELVPTRELSKVAIRSGDRIEIVTLAGGG